MTKQDMCIGLWESSLLKYLEVSFIHPSPIGLTVFSYLIWWSFVYTFLGWKNKLQISSFTFSFAYLHF